MKCRILFLISIAIVAFLSGCSESYKGNEADDAFQVGFITVGPVSDWGYNYAHNEGRLFMEGNSEGAIKTLIVENVPESSEVERVMERMINNGIDLIFPTSYGYLDSALRVAERYPDTTFMHCGGYRNAPNLGTYFAYIHEPMYVAGLVAGRMTESNKLGFVAAHPIPQVLRNINAFTMGARSVNATAEVSVVWTNNWYDPAIEAEAAQSLIDLGADVLTMHQDSPITVVQTAEKAGVYSVGYHANLEKFAPKGWLTGAAWDWGKIYFEIANSVKSGTWETGQFRAGISSGLVEVAPFGSGVPFDVREEALEVQDRIASGELVVFAGPVFDRDGVQRIQEGQVPDFEWMEKMDWFVEGVVGSLSEQ